MNQAYPELQQDQLNALLCECNEFDPVAMLVFDNQNNLLWFNKVVQDFFGVHSDLEKGTPAVEVFETLHRQCVDPDPHRDVVETVGNMADLVYVDYLQLEDGRAFERLTSPSKSLEGCRIWRLYNIAPIRDFFAGNTLADSFMQDQASEQIRIAERLHLANQELAAAKADLEILASTDQLTGLPNRRSFFLEADRYTNSGETPGKAVVMMVDIDHFKSVNDTWGHACGDEAIRLLANIIRGELRPSDIVARMGGEEYAAILKDCDLNNATKLAESIRAHIEATPLEYEDNVIHMTASLGLAALTISDRASVEAGLDKSDQALYEAKENGRNRVAIHADKEQGI